MNFDTLYAHSLGFDPTCRESGNRRSESPPSAFEGLDAGWSKKSQGNYPTGLKRRFVCSDALSVNGILQRNVMVEFFADEFFKPLYKPVNVVFAFKP